LFLPDCLVLVASRRRRRRDASLVSISAAYSRRRRKRVPPSDETREGFCPSTDLVGRDHKIDVVPITYCVHINKNESEINLASLNGYLYPRGDLEGSCSTMNGGRPQVSFRPDGKVTDGKEQIL